MNRSNLKRLKDVEIVGDERKAYFFEGNVIAMEQQGVISLLPTTDTKVSEVYNEMLLETGYEHYVKDGKSFIVDHDNKSNEITEAFCLRIKETL